LPLSYNVNPPTAPTNKLIHRNNFFPVSARKIKKSENEIINKIAGIIISEVPDSS
jgi:hypothetical protein